MLFSNWEKLVLSSALLENATRLLEKIFSCKMYVFCGTSAVSFFHFQVQNILLKKVALHYVREIVLSLTKNSV